MLKRLLDLIGAAEAAGRASRSEGEPRAHVHRSPAGAVRRAAIGQSNGHDFAAVYAYAIDEGLCEEKAYVLGTAYADSISLGKSNAYSIVYAAAYGIACSIIGASERWARAYAQACAHAIAARESIGFASLYGRAIADGVSPEDALVFARRFAV